MKSLHQRRSLVERDHPQLSVVQQCFLLAIHRSGLYYKPKEESPLNEELMRLMDEHYLKHPEKGAPRMQVWLRKDLGYEVSLKRVERLYYKVMGLRAVLPGPHTSKRHKDHKVYPYLLRELSITHANQVWATDITYIPMAKGFMYLLAVIDLHSRMVLHWSVSNTMEASWCKEVVEEAIQLYGKPEIFNTDQGAQFTSEVFSQFILGQGIKLSMPAYRPAGMVKVEPRITHLWSDCGAVSSMNTYICIRPRTVCSFTRAWLGISGITTKNGAIHPWRTESQKRFSKQLQNWLREGVYHNFNSLPKRKNFGGFFRFGAIEMWKTQCRFSN